MPPSVFVIARRQRRQSNLVAGRSAGVPGLPRSLTFARNDADVLAQPHPTSSASPPGLTRWSMERRHVAGALFRSIRYATPRGRMDCRVKPGNDAVLRAADVRLLDGWEG